MHTVVKAYILCPISLIVRRVVFVFSGQGVASKLHKRLKRHNRYTPFYFSIHSNASSPRLGPSFRTLKMVY